MKSTLSNVAAGLVLLAAPAFLACAPHSPYGYDDPYYDARYSSADEEYCRRVASDYSGNTAVEVGKGAVVGGAVGAAAGAAAGAIAGDAGKGAAIGAATGGVGGAVVQGARKHERYNDVYASCMRERGHRVY
jgi:hypothetical protein